MKHPETVQIIIGTPTQGNLKRARAVAEALDLQGFGSSGEFLARTWPTEEVFVAWWGGPGSKYSRHGLVPKNRDCMDGTVIDLRPMADKGLFVQLNAAYTAEVINDGKTVKVGCQKFPASKVLELADMLRESGQ